MRGMESKLFFFFELIVISVVEYQGQPTDQWDYIIKENVNLVRSVSFVVNRDEDPNDDSFQIISNLDSDTRKRLCAKVKDGHSLFLVGTVVGEADSFEMEDLDGNLTIVKALECPTKRNSWLSFDGSTQKLVVTLLVHVAEQYTFGSEYIKSIERKMDYQPSEDDFWGQLRNNYLNTLHIIDRSYFCFWAHEKVDVFTPAQQDENRTNEMCDGQYAAIWEVEYNNSEKKKVVAIGCGVKPRMFLRLVSPDDRTNRLVAMFLEHEVNPLSKLPPPREIK